MNVCPVCRNVNPNDATVCRYCNAALTPPTVATVVTTRSQPIWPWITGVLVAVVLLFVVIQGAGTGTVQAVGPATLAIGTGEGASLEFVPKVVTAPANTELAVTFTNYSTLPHNLAFEEPIAAKTSDIPGGANETINITTPAPGAYKFVCTIHPGMEGEMDVQ